MNDPGRSRTRNLQMSHSLSHYGTFVPLTGVSLTFIRGRRPRTRAGVLESDALPLCYRAILYGTNRDLCACKLSSFDRATLLRAARGRPGGRLRKWRRRVERRRVERRRDERRRDEWFDGRARECLFRLVVMCVCDVF